MLGALGRLVAPDVPPIQDLQHHWISFLEYYSQRPVAQLKAEPVERTNLAFHLNKILSLLVAEQDERREDLGPCLEFVLHQDILNILVTLCQADTPPGIRPYIFKVFIFLVEKVAYPLLPETSCHLALCRLTLVCSLTKASPTESQEVEFLSMLCTKVEKDPNLVQVFLPEENGPSPASLSSRSSRSNSSINLDQIGMLTINVKEVLENVKSRHYLASALLNYLDSSDYLLACTAMRNLLLLSALDNETSAHALVTGSPFLGLITARLISLAKAVPESLPPEQMEELLVNWSIAHNLHRTGSENEDYPGRTELIAYLSFLNYVDQLSREAHPVISEALADCLGQQFLPAVIQPRIGWCGIKSSTTADRSVPSEATLVSGEAAVVSDDAAVVSGLSFLAATWSHVRSERLSAAVSRWFLGRNSPLALVVGDEEGGTPLLWVLSLSEQKGELGLEALRLFDSLLASPSEPLLDGLLTSFVEGRGYYRNELVEAEAASWSDVEDERERSRPLQSPSPPRKFSGAWRTSKTLAPSNIHRVVNLWLYLVVDELRLDELRGSGYDMYVKDATRQLETVRAQCAGFSWPLESTPTPTTTTSRGCRSETDTSSTDSRSESDSGRNFWAGPLLEALLDKLTRILDSDYDANLQLTSVLSKLCQLPHPHLHEYLVNPSIPLLEGTRSIYTSLRDVLLVATERAGTIEHFPKKMRAARRKLLGDPTSSDSSDPIKVLPEEERLVEAIVVIDEFCKELAAISLVKYHLNSA